MFEPAIYAARRNRLKTDVGSGLILLLGNDEVGMNYAANTYHFRQDSTFLYYFAVDLPGLAAVIDVDEATETLYGDDLTMEDIVWTGPQPTMADHCRRGGVGTCAPAGELEAKLTSAIRQGRRSSSIVAAEASLEFIREEKIFANSEGAFVEQTLIESGGGMEALAANDTEVQKRSYPNSFGRHQGTAGYELIESMDLVGNGGRVGEEATALLTAPQCPSGVLTVILGPTQLALQVHESCGHPIELDRVLGSEAAYAGTSFLTLDKLGAFQYGSPIVNITADATTPGGLGTFGYDDEGAPAQATPIIRAGRFVGYLTSRETARRIGQTTNATMRADGWNRVPIIRMTNINLEPGEWAFDDLLADSDGALYMEMNKSWSIDDKRLNFQFATEAAWLVQGGRLGQMYKNATYTGITPQFWSGCDAICSRRHWNVWGTPNCGKGQPSQTAHVGHGAAPARFRNVQVGVMQ